MANIVKDFAQQVFTDKWQLPLHFLLTNLSYSKITTPFFVSPRYGKQIRFQNSLLTLRLQL